VFLFHSSIRLNHDSYALTRSERLKLGRRPTAGVNAADVTQIIASAAVTSHFGVTLGCQP
jgi:hypothetical protein